MCGTGLLESAVQVPKPLLQALRHQSLAYACECAHAMSTFMRANHNHPPRSIHDVSTRGARVGHGVRTEKSRSLVGSSSIKKLGLSANVLSSCSLRRSPPERSAIGCAQRDWWKKEVWGLERGAAGSRGQNGAKRAKRACTWWVGSGDPVGVPRGLALKVGGA